MYGKNICQVRRPDTVCGDLLVTIPGVTAALFIALEVFFSPPRAMDQFSFNGRVPENSKSTFEHKAEYYVGLDDDKAYTQRVNRVKKSIAEENAVKLYVLARPEQQSG